MPREGHADTSKIIPHPVRKGKLISTAVEGGFARKPAPADGIYFEVEGGGYFLDSKTVDDALQALYLDIAKCSGSRTCSADVHIEGCQANKKAAEIPPPPETGG